MTIIISLLKYMFHRCVLLKRSSKGITGMILKCEVCGRRYKIQWDDYQEMHKDVKLPDIKKG